MRFGSPGLSWTSAALVATLGASSSAALAQVQITEVNRVLSATLQSATRTSYGTTAPSSVAYGSTTDPSGVLYPFLERVERKQGAYADALATSTTTLSSTSPQNQPQTATMRAASSQRSNVNASFIRFDGEAIGRFTGPFTLAPEDSGSPQASASSRLFAQFRVQRATRLRLTLAHAGGSLVIFRGSNRDDSVLRIEQGNIGGGNPVPAPRVMELTLPPGTYTMEANAARRLAFQADFLRGAQRGSDVTTASFGPQTLSDDASIATGPSGGSSGSTSNGNAGGGSSGGGTTPPTPPSPRRARGEDRRRR